MRLPIPPISHLKSLTLVLLLCQFFQQSFQGIGITVVVMLHPLFNRIRVDHFSLEAVSAVGLVNRSTPYGVSFLL
jgi:hypothetical protein